jgi:prevent-host-death family protein
MTTVTMLEFRQNADAIIRKVQAGESLLLTYRGKPAVRLEPVDQKSEETKSTMLSICDLAQQWDSSADSTQLTNEDIDRIVYGL